MWHQNDRIVDLILMGAKKKANDDRYDDRSSLA
jgi:hypothetical protein